MEIWQDIPSYEGYYQASSLGRIRSLSRVVRQKGPKSHYNRKFRSKVLKPRLQNSGYQIVWLSLWGDVTAYLVHRLVAETFIENVNNNPCINHKNGDKTDNRAENLEWCSYSENIKHSYGFNRKEIAKPIYCVELNKSFQSQAEAAQSLGINRCGISHALNGRSKSSGGLTWRFM